VLKIWDNLLILRKNRIGRSSVQSGEKLLYQTLGASLFVLCPKG